MRLIRLNLILAIAYAITGKLGLLLAIPPGYATAIFPAAGIAIGMLYLHGYRLLPGVFIGSFGMNLLIGLSAGAPSFTLMVSGTGIALGASLQAACGKLLLDLYTSKSRDVFDNGLQIIKVILLAGPLACLISASTGMLTLYSLDLISADVLIYSWANWWVGDTMGVIVFLPVFILWTTKLRQQSLSRKFLATLPVMLAFSVSIAFFFVSSYWEERETYQRYANSTRQLPEKIAQRMQENKLYLHNIERFYISSSFVDRNEFRTFTETFDRNYRGIKALEWIPRVKASELEKFQDQLQQDLGKEFYIKQLDQQGKFVAANGRAVYYPVLYVEPIQGNETAIGYDLSSNPERYETIIRATQDTTERISTPVSLVQSGRQGFLLFYPVFKHIDETDQLLGLVLAVYDSDEFFNAIFTETERKIFSIYITDKDSRHTSLYCSNECENHATEGYQAYANSAFDYKNVYTTHVGGRDWQISVLPTREYALLRSGLLSWTVLLVGLLVTSGISQFLVYITNRTLTINNLVHKRTEELEQVTNALEEHAQRLQEAHTEAVMASKAKSMFLANMSHEIRTPLNGILGITHLLIEDTRDENTRDSLRIIESSGKSLLTIINDILDISKMEAGKLDLHSTHFDIRKSINDVVSILQNQAEEHQTHIVLDYELANDWYIGDEVRIRQILFNLLGNAIKFTEHGEVRIHVSETGEPGNAQGLYFSIEDTGIGLSENDRKKLFQSFSQADASSSRKYGGTGLGLAICKSLVELMGGEIWVESMLGAGSQFRFTLQLPIGQSAQQSNEDSTLATQTTDTPLRILVAEDNEVNQYVIVAMLEKLGQTCDIAKDGVEAVAMTTEQTYDLILMDCQMPNMDGYDATRAIRQLDNLVYQPKIIALTANVFKNDIERCYECGMEGVIGKPIQFEELQKLLRTIPSQHSLQSKSA